MNPSHTNPSKDAPKTGAKPASKAAGKSAVKSSAKPASKVSPKSAAKPSVKSSVKPSAKPAPKAAPKPAVQSVSKSAAKTAPDMSASVTMKGYDKTKAVAFMLPKLDKSEFKPLAAQSEQLLCDAIEADMAYMLRAGVLTADGMMGDEYYDDDDAFEFILERMARARKMSESAQGPLASFIDQYLDLQQLFLEESGLMDWD